MEQINRTTTTTTTTAVAAIITHSLIVTCIWIWKLRFKVMATACLTKWKEILEWERVTFREWTEDKWWKWQWKSVNTWKYFQFPNSSTNLLSMPTQPKMKCLLFIWNPWWLSWITRGRFFWVELDLPNMYCNRVGSWAFSSQSLLLIWS